MKIGSLILRIVVGGLFVAHGTQKWFGWFDGPGFEGTKKMTDRLSMRPARLNAHLVSGSETIGGAMIATGALTPAAASALIATMITAIRKVHLENGPFNSKSGYEFNLTLIAALLAIVDRGPGPLSIDEALGTERKGSGWALAALAAGAAGSAIAIEAGQRAANSETEAP